VALRPALHRLRRHIPAGNAVALDDPERLGRDVGGLYAAQTGGNTVALLTKASAFAASQGDEVTRGAVEQERSVLIDRLRASPR
jgi:hypothetical protein